LASNNVPVPGERRSGRVVPSQDIVLGSLLRIRVEAVNGKGEGMTVHRGVSEAIARVRRTREVELGGRG